MGKQQATSSSHPSLLRQKALANTASSTPKLSNPAAPKASASTLSVKPKAPLPTGKGGASLDFFAGLFQIKNPAPSLAPSAPASGQATPSTSTLPVQAAVPTPSASPLPSAPAPVVEKEVVPVKKSVFGAMKIKVCFLPLCSFPFD